MSSARAAALVPAFSPWCPGGQGFLRESLSPNSLPEVGAGGDIGPYSWRFLAPTLLRCVLVLESPNSRHPGAVKVVSLCDVSGSGEGLALDYFISIHFSSFPAVGSLSGICQKARELGFIAHAGSESGSLEFKEGHREVTIPFPSRMFWPLWKVAPGHPIRARKSCLLQTVSLGLPWPGQPLINRTRIFWLHGPGCFLLPAPGAWPGGLSWRVLCWGF